MGKGKNAVLSIIVAGALAGGVAAQTQTADQTQPRGENDTTAALVTTANQAIDDIVYALNPSGLHFAFLDPYNLEFLSFDLIEKQIVAFRQIGPGLTSGAWLGWAFDSGERKGQSGPRHPPEERSTRHWQSHSLMHTLC